MCLYNYELKDLIVKVTFKDMNMFQILNILEYKTDAFMIHAHWYSCVVFVKPLDMANNGRVFIRVNLPPFCDFIIF